MAWIESHGLVTRGHRVASGACGDARFPAGTIAPQLPFFRRLVPDFEAWLGGPAHPGTINLLFADTCVTILAPEIVVRDVRWTERFPPEAFFLSRAELATRAGVHRAFLYIPDPATKPDHPTAPGVVELLAGFVPGLDYGAPVALRHSPDAIRLTARRAPPRAPPPRGSRAGR